jgi:Protein of unknown function (DUF3237)
MSTEASPARRSASSLGLVACGLVACGLVACGLVACGLVACGLVACGLVACGLGANAGSPSTITNISVNGLVGVADFDRDDAPYADLMEFAQSHSSGAAPVTGPRLPQPHLTLVYRLEAALGQPQDVGETTQGHRRIVPLTGGTFAGPQLSGELLPGGSADWQVLLPDGTSIADLRYTLRTGDGAVLYVQARGARHGSPDVLARLGRGENVDASEYTFRTSAQIETAAPELGWLNKGVFISVGGRQPGGVIDETYLVA